MLCVLERGCRAHARPVRRSASAHGAAAPATDSAQRAMQGVEDELVHGARVAEPHLGLGRMHVDVHLTRVDLQEQHEGGMAVVVQHVLVGLPDRVRRELVAHEAAVHEEILRIAAAARMRRQPDRAVQPQTRARYRRSAAPPPRNRRRASVLDALGERLRLQADALPRPLCWSVKPTSGRDRAMRFTTASQCANSVASDLRNRRRAGVLK